MQSFRMWLATLLAGSIIPLVISGVTTAGPAMPVANYVQTGPEEVWWTVTKWALPVILFASVPIAGYFVYGYVQRYKPRPTVAEVKREVGLYDEQRRVLTLRAQKAENALNRTVSVSAPLATVAPDEPIVKQFSDGLQKLTRSIIPLGYTDKGEIVTWDVSQTPHIRVHGKTQGSGKTNLIKTIALCALKMGHHVIVLDRRGFKDWGEYKTHAEMLDNRKAGVFASTTSQIKALYQRRDEKLGQMGVSNISDLHNEWRRVFVVIGEFGTACREAQPEELEIVIKNLKSTASEAGATGVHLVYEAQVVNRDWPRELRGNSDVICGYLPEDAAKAGGYSYAYELKPYEFHYDGQRFHTWDMKRYAKQVLLDVRPVGKTLIDGRSQSVPESFPGNDSGTHFPEGNAGNVPVPSVENSLKNIYLRYRSWEEVAKEYFVLHPESEHSDWVKAMATIADDGRPYTDFKGRLSSNLFHTYSPRGDKSKV